MSPGAMKRTRFLLLCIKPSSMDRYFEIQYGRRVFDQYTDDRIGQTTINHISTPAYGPPSLSSLRTCDLPCQSLFAFPCKLLHRTDERNLLSLSRNTTGKLALALNGWYTKDVIPSL